MQYIQANLVAISCALHLIIVIFGSIIARVCCMLDYIPLIYLSLAFQNYLPDELVRYTVKLILSKPETVPEARTGILPILSALAATPMLSQHDVKEALDIIMTHKSLRLDSVSSFDLNFWYYFIISIIITYLHRIWICISHFSHWLHKRLFCCKD